MLPILSHNKYALWVEHIVTIYNLALGPPIKSLPNNITHLSLGYTATVIFTANPSLTYNPNSYNIPSYFIFYSPTPKNPNVVGFIYPYNADIFLKRAEDMSVTVEPESTIALTLYLPATNTLIWGMLTFIG